MEGLNKMREILADGELPSSGAFADGCEYSPPDGSPFRRSLRFIEARNKRVLEGSNGEFREYDETNTTNQG